MIRIPRITCNNENHQKMPYQFICMNQKSLQNGSFLCCMYCCQQYHQYNTQDIISIKEFVHEMQDKITNKGYNLLKILLQGLETCENYNDFKTNIGQILGYRQNPNRFEQLLDDQTKGLCKITQKYYQRATLRETKDSISLKQKLNEKPFVTPILSFKANPSYTLNSPFSVTSIKQQITTIFAYPSLSKFHQSMDVKIKINRYTPAWLGVGLSYGLARYQEKSSKHILAISNGWISNKGQLKKSKLRFEGGDEIQIKWNKDMQLVDFITSKRDKLSLKLQSKWNEQIYLCICLFYKGDTVSILE